MGGLQVEVQARITNDEAQDQETASYAYELLERLAFLAGKRSQAFEQLVGIRRSFLVLSLVVGYARLNLDLQAAHPVGLDGAPDAKNERRRFRSRAFARPDGPVSVRGRRGFALRCQRDASQVSPTVCLNVKIQALISILKFEADSKISTKQRLTVNHATMQPKSIRGTNFYRSARLQLRHRHNACAACAYVFRESTFGQT